MPVGDALQIAHAASAARVRGSVSSEVVLRARSGPGGALAGGASVAASSDVHAATLLLVRAVILRGRAGGCALRPQDAKALRAFRRAYARPLAEVISLARAAGGDAAASHDRALNIVDGALTPVLEALEELGPDDAWSF